MASHKREEFGANEKYLHGTPAHLHDSLRTITTILSNITTVQKRVKRFFVGAYIHIVRQEISKFSTEVLEQLLVLKWVKDLSIWNMKSSESHEDFTFFSNQSRSSRPAIQPGDTDVPCESLKPIVVECITYAETNRKDKHEDPAVVAKMFRDDYTKKLEVNASTITALTKLLPVVFGNVKATTPLLLDVIKRTMALLLIEFAEDPPYMNQCDGICYDTTDYKNERLHCFAITNPPTLSARKLIYIRDTFVAHIKTIRFTTQLQKQTTNVQSAVLAVIFTELLPGHEGGSISINGYGKNMHKGNKYHPYEK